MKLQEPDTTERSLDRDTISRLLESLGVKGEAAAFPLGGGRNNRVYEVKCDGLRFLAKHYFEGSHDPRNRLDAEFCFARFLWDHGLRQIPQPLSCDKTARIALFEFIDGTGIKSATMSESHIKMAAEFLREANQFRNHTEASLLPLASEACFSFSDHLSCVEQRIARLECIVQKSAIDNEMVKFVQTVLRQLFGRISGSIKKCVNQTEELTREEWCLSPSDFGFHNALWDGTQMRFFDFEYAGWDDPAKTVCDFFCQIEVPVPLSYFDAFLERLFEVIPIRNAIRFRVEQLMPLYQLKWCCIVLNEFLAESAQRRKFSLQCDSDQQKQIQLDLARRLAARIGETV